MPNSLTCLDVQRDKLAGLVAGAGTNGDDLAFLRLLLGGVRNDDAAFGLFLGVDPADDDAVMKWERTRQALADTTAGVGCG